MHTFMRSIRCCTFALLATCLMVLAGCASTGSDGGYGVGQRAGGGKVLACRSGDELVRSQQQCLQDDAACYELSNGQWCTGDRSNSCPAGSSPLAAGAACPNGARCIQFSESLNCAIQIR